MPEIYSRRRTVTGICRLVNQTHLSSAQTTTCRLHVRNDPGRPASYAAGPAAAVSTQRLPVFARLWETFGRRKSTHLACSFLPSPRFARRALDKVRVWSGVGVGGATGAREIDGKWSNQRTVL